MTSEVNTVSLYSTCSVAAVSARYLVPLGLVNAAALLATGREKLGCGLKDESVSCWSHSAAVD